MSEPTKNTPLQRHFNPHGALNRLERGDDPNEVFGLDSDSPWKPLTAKAFQRSFIGSGEDAKPIINTLITAACRDVGRALTEAPLERYTYRPSIVPYTMHDPVVDPDSREGTIKQSLKTVWYISNSNASEAIRSAPLPVFNKVLDSCGSLVSIPLQEAGEAVRKRIEGNLSTLSSRGVRYMRLLATVYDRDIKKIMNDPEFDSTLTIVNLLDLVRSSYPIIGQPAGADFDFHGGHIGKFEGYDLELREMKYREEKFELKKQKKGDEEVLRVAPLKIEIKALQAEHDEEIKRYAAPEIVTGCPANAELIEAILRRFKRNVYVNAEAP